MPLFAYRAIDTLGHPVRGQRVAANEMALSLQLKRQGMELLRASPVQGWFRIGRVRAISRRDRIHLYFQLEQLCRAGVPLMDALMDLRDSESQADVCALLATLVDAIEGGATLSQAMAQQPHHFDALDTHLVRAGEYSGKLPDILERMASSHQWRDELQAHLHRVLAYPLFLLIVMAGMSAFLMIYLVPRLTAFMMSMGQTPPWPTRVLSATSTVFIQGWPFLLVMLALVTVLIAQRHRWPWRVRLAFDAGLLRLPWIGTLWHKAILARWADLLGLMYASGIPVLEALASAQGVAGNLAIVQVLEQVRQRIDAGSPLCAAFQASGAFPPLVIRMIRIGESTAALDRALQQVSHFYSRDVHVATARLEAVMGPILTLLLGLLMGWIMFATLGPLYDALTRLDL
jgi:type IV pilus assembly protein PilC